MSDSLIGWRQDGSAVSMELVKRNCQDKNDDVYSALVLSEQLYSSHIQPGSPTPICDEITGEIERVLKRYRPVPPIRDSKIGDAVSHGTANSIEYLLLINREVGSGFADRQRFLHAMRRGFDRSKN